MKWYIPWEPPVPDTRRNRVIAYIGAWCALISAWSLILACSIVGIYILVYMIVAAVKALGG